MLSFGNANVPACGYHVSITRDSRDIEEAQRFRAQRFALPCARDEDELDAACDHILIRDAQNDAVVCCFRMFKACGADIGKSYAARYYDLTALEKFDGQILELGRFCIDTDRRDPNILRLAWATLTADVDDNDVKLLFGCSSFAGTDPSVYQSAFAYLHEHARAPDRWLPKYKSQEVLCLATSCAPSVDRRLAFQQMPPLLRSYIGMRGWVSDHAVIDRRMNTLHVFTAVETAAIPPARQRLLRALRDAQR